MSRMFDITYSKTVFEDIENRSLSWIEFIELLETESRTTDVSSVNMSDKEEVKKVKSEQSAFTTSKMKGDKRGNEFVVLISMLRIDVDGSDIELDDLIDRLESLGVDYLVYTTFSHGVTGNNYRIVIPLSKDITGTMEEMELLFKAITKTVGADLEVTEYLDRMSWTLSQEMYMPHYQEGINEGELVSKAEGNYLDYTDYIDVDKVLTSTVDNKAPKEHIEGTGNDYTADVIIDKILKSKDADIFNKLYYGENLDLDEENQSSLDMTLANKLAFWTNRDFDKMDKMFRSSKLMRNKWDSKRSNSTYGKDTLLKAISEVSDGYGADKEEVPSWIEQSKTGRKRLVTGILAEHLATTVEAKYTGSRFYIYDDGVYNECEESEEQTKVMELIPTDVRTTNGIYDVVNQWSIYKGMRVSPNDWNNENYILNLKNGLYNINTKTLVPHDPKHLSTVRINANYDTTAEGKEWDKFIERVVPNETYRKIVQEILGYSLTTFNNIKKMFILDGESNTGKSVYLNVIQYLLGDKNVSNIELQSLSERFNKVHLYGKVANIFGDLPTTPIKENLFKALTGDDSINAERKGQEGFSFKSKAKLLFSTNGMPSNYGDNSSAFYGRLMIIPFNEVIPLDEQDPLLKDKLQAESDYILQWGLEGLHRVIDNDFKFTHCEDMEDRVREYRKEGNVVMQFIDEEMDIITDDSDKDLVTKADLYPLYNEYCIREGHRQVLGKQNFNKEMKRLGYKEVRRDNKICWSNVYPKFTRPKVIRNQRW